MRHIVPISGKDSLAAALVQTARRPDLRCEFFFNDVGTELPETYAWLARVEAETGWPIRRVGKSLREMIAAFGGYLPSRRVRYCTRHGKIEPMEAFIGYDAATVYYGLRADEPERVGYVPFRKTNIVPAYPLRDLGIDLHGVYAILEARGLTPPDFFWPRLHAAVGVQLAAWDGWESSLTPVQRRELFAGRTRANCFFCFFQRRYELLWLRETHPDLFAEMRSLEKDDYCWREGFPLSRLDDAAVRDRLFGRRVDEVCKTITGKFQGGLFGESGDNEIALVSCGLLCGK